MSQLKDLLEKVKDEHLSLPLCEKYRDELIHLKTELHHSIADFKKKRAIFLVSSEVQGVEARKMAFDATPDGLRLIELKGMIGGLQGEIDSLQGRIYGHLRLQG